MSYKFNYLEDHIVESIFIDSENKSYKLVFKRIDHKLYVDFDDQGFWTYCADYNSISKNINWKQCTLTHYLYSKNCSLFAQEAWNWFNDLKLDLAQFMMDSKHIKVEITRD